MFSKALLSVCWPLQTDQLQRNSAHLHGLLDVLHRPGGSKWNFSHLISSCTNPSLSALPWCQLVCGHVKAKAWSTQINCAFCPERCVEGYSFPSSLRVRKHMRSQTTFYLHGHHILLFFYSLCVCEWVRVFPAANFVLFLPDGWKLYVFFFLELFSYLVILMFVVTLQAKTNSTDCFVRNILIHYFCSTEFESRCAWIHLLWTR